MKSSVALFFLGLFSASIGNAVTLLSFDFSGATATAASNSRTSTFSDVNVEGSTITRGAGISANNAANSFRGTGFSNNGIALSNTDFFQFTISAAPGYTLTIDSIYGNFNGTSTFSASPGVTMAYAFSLDNGSTFTLMPSFTRVGTGNHTYSISSTFVADLTDVSSVTFKLFASGQTTTGGWGLQSAATVGTIGLSVDGSVDAISSPIPEPSAYAAILGAFVLAGVVTRRRRA